MLRLRMMKLPIGFSPMACLTASDREAATDRHSGGREPQAEHRMAASVSFVLMVSSLGLAVSCANKAAKSLASQ